ncbi:hypothetical protein [Anaerocellum diazotrophicum]|uniref:Uncharacterized protein n=1 Tax=Caldicellulosiruptor diazotrophicus TaxID=2806205 RepID=A0ABM7NP96_9FIRM|nr:hypothetical protein [Caldicellulosiruptor diazotrophicus]BCS81985.1 hypothetical protein CaldiYA01_19450 [Caldicellulosiruptor diazotrophicus]
MKKVQGNNLTYEDFKLPSCKISLNILKYTLAQKNNLQCPIVKNAKVEYNISHNT